MNQNKAAALDLTPSVLKAAMDQLCEILHHLFNQPESKESSKSWMRDSALLTYLNNLNYLP